MSKAISAHPYDSQIYWSRHHGGREQDYRRWLRDSWGATLRNNRVYFKTLDQRFFYLSVFKNLTGYSYDD